MRTPALLPVPPTPGVGAAIGTAGAVQITSHFFAVSVQITPPPSPPCAGTCGDTAGEDAGVSTHATVAGDDGSGRPIGSGRVSPIKPPYAGV